MDYKQIMKDRLELFEAIETIGKNNYFVDEVHGFTCLIFGLDEASYKEIFKQHNKDYYTDGPCDPINHLKNEINENGANLLIINND